MLSTPANPCLSTALPTAIQPEPAGDLSPVPACPLPPPPYPRVPPGSLHQLGPWLPKPVLCACQGKGAQAGPEEACQCWGRKGGQWDGGGLGAAGVGTLASAKG